MPFLGGCEELGPASPPVLTEYEQDTTMPSWKATDPKIIRRMHRKATKLSLLDPPAPPTTMEVRAFAEKRRRHLDETVRMPEHKVYYVHDERHGRVKVTKHVFELVKKDRKEACPQRTPPWYEKRNNHITASVMATVCGKNPYESIATAIYKKTGLGAPFKGNAATRHGNENEFVAIQKYEKFTQQKCLEFGLLESLNPGEEFLAGSPDGITTTGRLIEVKCPYRRMPTEEVPEHYVFQVQFLMHTLKLEVCDFIQYVPETIFQDEVFIVTEVPYSPGFWCTYWPRLQRFWQHVLEVRAIGERAGLRSREQGGGDDSDFDSTDTEAEESDDANELVIDDEGVAETYVNGLSLEKITAITVKAVRRRPKRKSYNPEHCVLDGSRLDSFVPPPPPTAREGDNTDATKDQVTQSLLQSGCILK
jgi:putative phage-type endonuclease